VTTEQLRHIDVNVSVWTASFTDNIVTPVVDRGRGVSIPIKLVNGVNCKAF